MRAWPVARSIFDAPLGVCERSERADNRLDKHRHNSITLNMGASSAASQPGNANWREAPIFHICCSAEELFIVKCCARGCLRVRRAIVELRWRLHGWRLHLTRCLRTLRARLLRGAREGPWSGQVGVNC